MWCKCNNGHDTLIKLALLQKINNPCSVCVNNLVVNTSIDKVFPIKQILVRVHTALCNTRYNNTSSENVVYEEQSKNYTLTISGESVYLLSGKANSKQTHFKVCQYIGYNWHSNFSACISSIIFYFWNMEKNMFELSILNILLFRLMLNYFNVISTIFIEKKINIKCIKMIYYLLLLYSLYL